MTGKGNYTGSRDLKLEIADKTTRTLISKVTIPAIPDQNYDNADYILAGTPKGIEKRALKNGSEFVFELKDKTHNHVLVYDTDFTLTYSDNHEVGTAKVVITGIGAYAGTVTKQFKIKGLDLSKAKQEGFKSSVSYTGSAIQESMKFYYGSGASKTYLTKGIDYTVEYAGYSGDIFDIGTYTVIYKGCGKCFGTVKKTFKITGIAMKNVAVSDLTKSFEYETRYNAKAKGFTYIAEPIKIAGPETGDNDYGITLTYRAGKTASPVTLVKGTDYTVSYEKNIEPGTATVIFTGCGKYSGTIKKTFKIVACELGSRVSVYYNSYSWAPAVCPTVAYTKGTTCPMPELKDTINSVYLIQGKDYTVSWSNNKAVKTSLSSKGNRNPMVTIKGKGRYSGTLIRFFLIEGSSFAGAKAVATNVVCAERAGLYKNTTVSITDTNGVNLKEGTDYYKKNDEGHEWKFRYAANTTVKLEDGPAVDVIAGQKVEDTHVIPKAAKIEVIVDGKGNYAGHQISATYKFVAADIDKAKVTVTSKQYTGSPVVLTSDDITVTLKVAGTNQTLVYGSDYEIVSDSYSNNVAKGTARVEIRAKESAIYGGSKVVAFKITSRQFNYTIRFDNAYDELIKALRVKDNTKTEEWYKENYRITGSMKDLVIPAKGKLTKNAFAVQKWNSAKKKWVNVPKSEIEFKGWNTEADGSGYPNGGVFADSSVFAPSWLTKLVYGSEWKLYAQWKVN